METEDASLNEEVIVRGSPDHDCYISGLTRQDEVVIAVEAVGLAEVAVPKVQSVSEAELFRHKMKNLDGTWCMWPTQPEEWWDPTALAKIIDVFFHKRLGTSRRANLDEILIWHLACVQRYAGCSSASPRW